MHSQAKKSAKLKRDGLRDPSTKMRNIKYWSTIINRSCHCSSNVWFFLIKKLENLKKIEVNKSHKRFTTHNFVKEFSSSYKFQDYKYLCLASHHLKIDKLHKKHDWRRNKFNIKFKWHFVLFPSQVSYSI